MEFRPCGRNEPYGISHDFILRLAGLAIRSCKMQPGGYSSVKLLDFTCLNKNSMAVQRGNAASVIGTLPNNKKLDEIFRL